MAEFHKLVTDAEKEDPEIVPTEILEAIAGLLGGFGSRTRTPLTVAGIRAKIATHVPEVDPANGLWEVERSTACCWADAKDGLVIAVEKEPSISGALRIFVVPLDAHTGDTLRLNFDLGALESAAAAFMAAAAYVRRQTGATTEA